MMKKFITLVLVLAFTGSVLADDLVPAPWRDTPGSTYSEWTYDDPCNVYGPYGPGGAPAADWPENSWFVSHPDKGDPCGWGDAAFSGQWWGNHYDPCLPGGDPCAPMWQDVLPFGRQGGVNYAYASWDLNNFIHDQPAKDLWIQMTYFTGGAAAEVDYAESGYEGWVEGDPCGVPMGEYEGPLSTFDPCMPVLDTWMEGTEVWGWTEEELSAWDPCWPDPLETWDDSQPGPGEVYTDLERIASTDLGNGWWHDVFTATLDVNPEWEYAEVAFTQHVLLDQIVIETLCYVPEPATMVLLGLGSLLMIRRKKR